MAEEWGPPPDATDIGGGHMIEYAYYHDEVAGINDWHKKPDGTWCVGWISFNGSAWAKQFPGKQGWDVVQRDPLTLTPSLLCRACGDHCHITNGRWVKA